GAARLDEALQGPKLRAEMQRDGAALAEARGRTRIEVQHQRVGTVWRRCGREKGMELDGPQVRRPEQRLRIVDQAIAYLLAARSRHRRRVRRALRAVALVPTRPIDSVGEPRERYRPAGEMRQQCVCGGAVPLDHLPFRERGPE